jgi:GTPase
VNYNVNDFLPPENDNGNIEYKAKLLNPSPSRLQHLITQMKWRLREGQGEAIYEIGVDDGGTLVGLTDTELKASISTLRKMASDINATVAIVSLGQATFTTRAFAIRKFSLFIVLGVSITVILVQI